MTTHTHLDPEAATDHLDELLREHDLPSLSVGIAQGDRVVSRGFGYSDLRGRRADGDTPYLLASVTKPIVSTLLVLLAQEGLIDLDEPLGDRLPWFDRRIAGRRGRPTVRQALSHRSGLGAHWDFRYGPDTADAEKTLSRHAVLIHEPGARFEYANLGYGLLAPWLSAATGSTIDELLHRHLFDPLDLRSAGYGTGYERRFSAVPYTRGDHRPYPTISTSHAPASLAWMSARDLARFGQVLAKRSAVLHDDSAAQLKMGGRYALDADSTGDRYGLGWNVRDVDGIEVLTHGGDMCGVGAVLAVIPDLGISVSALSNQTGSYSQALSACEMLVDGVVGRLRDQLGDEAPGALDEGSWTGTIQTAEGHVPLHLEVQAEGEALLVVAGSAPVRARYGGADGYRVTLSADVQLPTEDARAASPGLELALDEDGRRLIGAARAVKHGEQGGLVGNCLSHWCELERLR